MPADKVRNTFDRTRQYGGVVAQQGRVTLEADINEGQVIEQETLRAETLDIVGPSGTPDDGYALLPALAPQSPNEVPFDFKIKAGTMYVGGLRISLPSEIQYGAQPDWLDHTADDLWKDPTAFGAPPPPTELIYLLLREQEVSAVEDSELLDIALGGPDTAQRTRLLQRVVRLSVDANSTCSSARDQAIKDWTARGATFDPQTMTLTSPAKLQVSFATPAASENPCDPSAPGTYLGADNQLIRVQLTAFDPATKKGKLVWAFNNASFMYRCALKEDLASIQLSTTPVDSYHAPRIGAFVEVLLTAVELDKKNQDYVAAPVGSVAQVTNYAPETGVVTFTPQLGSKYAGALQYFVRLWEAELDFTLTEPVSLGNTGVQLTITDLTNAGTFTVGQHWMFAVRPGTSTVYPARYQDSPQPPDGPRLWACPLGVVSWKSDPVALVVLADCRLHFDNLVALTGRTAKTDGCCSITLTPDDFGGGSKLVDALAQMRDLGGKVCFRPGIYNLTAPILLRGFQSHVRLEACQEGTVTLEVQPGSEQAFLDGLIVLTNTANFALDGLTIVVPLAAFAGVGVAGLSFDSILGLPAGSLQLGIGVRALDTTDLAIRRCKFLLSGPSMGTAPAVPTPNMALPGIAPAAPTIVAQPFAAPFGGAAPTAFPSAAGATLGAVTAQPIAGVTAAGGPSLAQPTPAAGPVSTATAINSFQVGILGGGACKRWTIEGNDFSGPAVSQSGGVLAAGILVVPSLFGVKFDASPGATVAGSLFAASLDDCTICGNAFDSLTASVVADADLGTISAERNTVRAAYAGIWFISMGSVFTATNTPDPNMPIAAFAVHFERQLEQDEILLAMLVMGRGYPVPSRFTSATLRTAASTTAPNARIPPGSALVNVHLALAAVERSAEGTPGFRQRLALRVANNHLEGLQLKDRAPVSTSSSLVVAGAGAADVWSSSIVSLNECRNFNPGPDAWPTAMISNVGRYSITGNIIANEAVGGSSFVLAEVGDPTNPSGPLGTLIGNVLKGNVSVPQRISVHQLSFNDQR